MPRRAPLLLAVLISSILTGCGGSSATATGPSRPAPGCDIALQGPLIGYSYQASPPPAPQGGLLADGTYDLVQIVKHTSHTGAWSSNMAPAFRWSIRFTTRDRSPNHASGDAIMALEIPPAVQCTPKRFATFQTELRTEGGAKGVETVAYTATGDTLMMLDMSGDGGAPHAYVFRRRP